ncbi:hypothetical protein MG293_007434 [Ovis ammon polii]|uniref:Antiluteolysin n=1 Tax=Ovis ammon polii TaxID=230172 RepID=A0AAD4UDH8_OVIAM|nr:hypothetical protein MG293_007434 [Ovis ammon polii]
MAFVFSLLMALVLVSYGPGGSLGCVLSQNHVLIGRKNLRLLGQMRRLSPRFCLQDRKDFAFPQEMVEGGQLQEAQAISVLHEMLQQSFNLFHTERASAAWNTTLLEQLCTGLHQQLDDLDACLGQVMGEEDSALGRTGPTLALKRYFQGIHVYLKEKEYSDCAWEAVRVEIMRSLSSSVSLQERKLAVTEKNSRAQALTLLTCGCLSFEPCLEWIIEAMKREIQKSNIENIIDDFASIKARNLNYCCGIKKIFEFDDRKDFAFPQEMVEGGQLQEAQAISVLHEMLQQSFNLFHTERSSAAWNTTLLKQLRNGLLDQLVDLDACLGQVMGEEDSALGRMDPTLAVKRCPIIFAHSSVAISEDSDFYFTHQID